LIGYLFVVSDCGEDRVYEGEGGAGIRSD
jgi:hypothetical protein